MTYGGKCLLILLMLHCITNHRPTELPVRIMHFHYILNPQRKWMRFSFRNFEQGTHWRVFTLQVPSGTLVNFSKIPAEGIIYRNTKLGSESVRTKLQILQVFWKLFELAMKLGDAFHCTFALNFSKKMFLPDLTHFVVICFQEFHSTI